MKQNIFGVFVGSKEKPRIMEVIGEKGLKVAEYVDKEDEPRTYQRLQEKVVME